MPVHVGTATLRGDVTKYARYFDLLELRAEKGKLPRPARLREMASAVPAGFVFSVVLPRAVGDLATGAAVEQELAYALDAATALSASWLVLRTEANVMPTARTRRALSELIDKLPEDRRIAWEPRGVWELPDAIALADELGVSLVIDASRETPPPADVLYTRLRALGRARISELALETVADEVSGYEEAYVVIEGEAAARAASALRTLCAGGAIDLEDEDEGELSSP